ncbi:MAG TPA: hypothetical protein VMR79_08135 [Verrucomicrobiae bacterium]|nr:hypothetical protein [Verrucomicrobiae bacterium]
MNGVRFPDEPLRGLLVPDIVRQSQFLNERASPARFSGEYRLALAILQDAIEIYCMEGSGRRNLQLRREAACWLGSSDRSWCFSFERICEALALEPDYIRRALRVRGERQAPALWEAIDDRGRRRRVGDA